MVLQGQSHNLGSYGSVAPAGGSSVYGAGAGAMGGQMQNAWNQYGATGVYGTTPSYGFDMQQQAYYGQQQQAVQQQGTVSVYKRKLIICIDSIFQ